MGTEVMPKDYLILLNEEIPKRRAELINTSKKLEDVAEHCLASYDESLEQTVNYTAQALGSVAYQINLLATNFLEVLDQQNIQLNGLQTKVNHLNMQVRIHQEKTARLSIGKYTLPRDPNALRPSKNIEPILEISNRYKRREIDFSALDNIGHGVKEPAIGGSVVMSNISRRSSASGSESHSTNYGYGSGNASLGPRSGMDYINRSSRIQTISRGSGIAASAQQNPQAGANTIYRAPVAGQPPMIQHQSSVGQYNSQSLGPRNNIQGSSNRFNANVPAPPVMMVSPQHRNNLPVASPTNPPPPQQIPANAAPSINQYGFPPGQIPVAPPPPPAMISPPPPQQLQQHDHNMAQHQQQIRYSNLPRPPSSDHQQQPPTPQIYQHNTSQHHHNLSDLPPPPNSDPYQQTPQQHYNTQDIQQQQQQQQLSLNISHLQPTASDVIRNKSTADHNWAPESYICKVITLYEYIQNKDDELSFGENQVIYVVKKNNDGWWEGIMATGTGLFPGNYVQTIN